MYVKWRSGFEKSFEKLFVSKKNFDNEINYTDKPRIKGTFTVIRYAALDEVVKTYKRNLAKMCNNIFTIHFKKKEGTK